MGGLTAAYLALRSGTQAWPPKGVTLHDYFGNMLAITVLMAAAFGWWVLYAVRRDEPRQAKIGLALAIFLQGAYVNLAVYVLAQGKFGPGTSPYGLISFALYGASIVLAGTGILVAITTLARLLGGQVTSRSPAMGWAAAWYTSLVAAGGLVTYALIYQVK
jgi:heme/copper-type cytochrome/quinol oxidase subunit 3